LFAAPKLIKSEHRDGIEDGGAPTNTCHAECVLQSWRQHELRSIACRRVQITPQQYRPDGRNWADRFRYCRQLGMVQPSIRDVLTPTGRIPQIVPHHWRRQADTQQLNFGPAWQRQGCLDEMGSVPPVHQFSASDDRTTRAP
jgi:hypothetical protein